MNTSSFSSMAFWKVECSFKLSFAEFSLPMLLLPLFFLFSRRHSSDLFLV